MITRHAYSVVGAAVLSCTTAAWAQTTHDSQIQEQKTTATATLGQADADEMQITLVGCLQRESDYREQQDAGRGGLVSTGVGLGNEFVLINASRAGSSGSSSIDCASASGGEAYELSGEAERNLEPFVGRMVEISGSLKRADLDDDDDVVGTSGATARPSGGFDPLGQDLRLHEVDVMSFRKVTAQAATALPSQTPSAQMPEQQRAQPTAAEQSFQTREELPRTASPLPLAGLLALLSLAGALGVRRMRR